MNNKLAKFLIHDFENSNHYYMKEKNIDGICFGASLQWATDFIKHIAGNKAGIKINIINRANFYNLSHKIQDSYDYIVDNTPGKAKITIAEILNKQDSFLARKEFFRIDYSTECSGLMDRYIQSMLNDDHEFQNTAFIISTKLKTSAQFNLGDGHRMKSIFKHATALVNYRGNIYLFDVNKGIYKLPGKRNIQTHDILEIIFSHFGAAAIPGNPYVLSPFRDHIIIKIKSQ